jgi:hypothetical protein
MYQAEDPRYAELLDRLRIQQPMKEGGQWDLVGVFLNEQWTGGNELEIYYGAHIPDPTYICPHLSWAAVYEDDVGVLHIEGLQLNASVSPVWQLHSKNAIDGSRVVNSVC